MKKIVAAIVTSLSFAAVVGATDIPRMETFLGYNFVRFNPNSGFVPSFNANGGSGQFVYNFNKWIGGVVDAGAVHKGVLNGISQDTTVAHLVAGPRISFHNHSRFTPFAQVLFGGAYGTTSRRIGVLPQFPPDGLLGLDPNSPITVRLQASETVFAMMAGGGLDIKLSKHVAFRPVAADYYLARVPRIGPRDDVNRNNWRLSAGINFMFGAQ
jgi:opacity protein-like surface antigen